MLPRALLFSLAALVAVPVAPAQTPKVDPDHAAKMAKGTELFKASVRGVFQAKCVKCHSGERVEGEFDMGTRESLLKGGHAGAALVPGDHKKSLLYQLVAHLKAPHMPHERAKLPDADIAKIAEWIDLGAPYDKPFLDKEDATAWTRKVVPADAKKHWAFQPLRNTKHKTPTTIDAFLDAKRGGLKPAPPADKRTLIRRVYLDLVGLPPTPEQVTAFLNDESATAFEKVVDELLASPRYGERWARHWLDLVRFAESHGFEHDYDRPTAYHYRDFVIKALNQDLPFDTFAKWQIAGDELAPNDNLALTATGYLAAGVHSTQITKSEVEKHRYDELDDVVANVGTTFLGLTIGCARCHDHKYDAIPARDYYRMLSAFTTTVRSEVELDTDPEGYKRAKAAFDAEHAPLAGAVARYEAEKLPAAFAAWEAARSDKPLSLDGWILPTMGAMKSAGGATLTKQDDGSVLVTGKNPTTETLTFTLTTDATTTALRIEALADASLIRNGPGRATNGNFALSDLKVTAQAAKGTPEKVKLANPRATFEQKGLPVAAAIDGDAQSAWAVDPQFGKSHAAAFDFEKPIGFPGGTTFVVTMSFHNNTGHGMGRPRLSLATTEKPVLTSPVTTEAVRAALALRPEKRTPVQTSALLKWYAPQDAGWVKASKAAADHLAKAPKPAKVKALISSEGLPPIRLHSQGDDFLKETHFLRRGDTAQKEGTAGVSFLQVLMPDAESQAKWVKPAPSGSRTTHRRAALADWLTDTESGAGPLAARVIVNRLWQHHFGRGIVSTPSDFGVRGEPPTHPELLDFLATELIRGGWKLKPLHRRMVLSAAYRQASRRDDKADPENKLFSRYPVRRLEAEVIRDSTLAAGGLLDFKMYGPGTLDEASKRRSVYFTMKRSKQIPALGVFDAPDGTAGVGERPSTTIAPQALHLMNNPHVRAAAKGLAARAREGPKTDAEAVARAYQFALCRPPTADELSDGVAFVKGNPEALADFCQVLFCLNEFLYQ